MSPDHESEPAGARRATLDELRKGFVTPPREAGPWVYWMFFDNVMSKPEITRKLEEMAAAGIAGAELRFLSLYGFTGVPGPWFDAAGWERLGQQRCEYLSPQFVDMLEHTCAEAQRLGLRLAINMGMGWPPGGPWITEEHRSKHLVASSTVVAGPQSLRGEQAMPVPPGALVSAWQLRGDSTDSADVVPESFRDLSVTSINRTRSDGTSPTAAGSSAMFHNVPGGLCDKGNGPEVDPGSREAVLFHLDSLVRQAPAEVGKILRIDTGRSHVGQLGVRAARGRAVLVAVPVVSIPRCGRL